MVYSSKLKPLRDKGKQWCKRGHKLKLPLIKALIRDFNENDICTTSTVVEACSAPLVAILDDFEKKNWNRL